MIYNGELYLYFTTVGADAELNTALQVIGLVRSIDGNNWSEPEFVLKPDQTLYPNPDDTLFHKVARAVCRAGTLPRKELHEAWELARRVRRRYRGGRVVDLACGHGLLAHLMLILDDSSKKAVAVDSNVPLNARKLSAALIESWPRLKNRIIFKQVPIQEISILADDMVVSAHACGSLTDLILDKAIEQHARVAVLPCCHDLKKSSTGCLDGWMDKTLAIDTVRAMRLSSQGYRVVTQEIPAEITPKNRLLMGEYMDVVQTSGSLLDP